MNTKLYISSIILTLMFAGCAAINMNHYQDGRSLGKNKRKGNIGLGTGLSFVTDTTRLDNRNYEVKTKRGPSSIFVSAFIRGGLTSKFDLGGELFTTFGSTGFKLYGKYALLDSTSKWGVALMPIVGFSYPWFEEEDGDEEDGDEDDINFTARTLIMEFAIPMSYHLSKRIAFIFGPKVYFHHNYIKTSGNDVDFHRKGSGTYFSPGASLGMHINTLRFEGTIVYLNKNNWMPYFGFSKSL